jgi:3-methylfumaryl-CoA hydratase
MSEWDAWIGKTETSNDILTAGLLQRFRATINSPETNETAPQGIHWCLCLAYAATADLGEDGHPRRSESSFLPPIPLPRRMWAASKLVFHAPLAVGDDICRTSTITGITAKSGGSGPLVFVDVDHEISANGVTSVSERQTVVYREAAKGPQGISVPGEGDADIGDWQWHRKIVPDEAMLFRYSALTFNSHRIHYDRPYAVGDEGYPGLVVQGPLTATLLLDLAASRLGANQLKTFSFRGQSPAYAGDILKLFGSAEQGKLTLTALGRDGALVMPALGSL